MGYKLMHIEYDCKTGEIIKIDGQTVEVEKGKLPALKTIMAAGFFFGVGLLAGYIF